jgi:hypothetical protein
MNTDLNNKLRVVKLVLVVGEVTKPKPSRYVVLCILKSIK